MAEPKYKRAVIKLSGEALAGEESFGLAHATLESIAKQVGCRHPDLYRGGRR